VYTIIALYILICSILLFAWLQVKEDINNLSDFVFYGSILLFLILFATFRNGDVLPDYSGYVRYFNSTVEKRVVEKSFYIIRYISNLIYENQVYILFFIYALIGVSLKFIAIKRYSPYVLYSIAVWISSFYILQDLIQIRASIAGGLLLLIIPVLQSKNYLCAALLTLIATTFHNSAIIFLLLFPLNKDSINWKIWTIFYMIAIIINISGLNFTSILNSLIKVLPHDLFNQRIGSYFTKDYELSNLRANMFSPYIMLQTLICFGSLYWYENIKKISHVALLSIKCCFISIFIYSLSIPGISMRLAELLSTPLIFLIPLIIDWLPSKYRVFNKTIVTIICFLLMSNFIFIKKFIIWK